VSLVLKENELRFEFGKNWAAFLGVLNDERIANAEASLKRALGVEDLRNKRFVDIGCGSGLFSLAAVRLGAEVHSFDYDAQSVACARELKRRYFPGERNWTIEQASVLDQEYLQKLGQFDIVYSWGVLHHTGDMWQALANIVPLVKKPDGELFIAIYNDLGTQTQRWRAIKRLYVSSSTPIRWIILVTLLTISQVKLAAGRLSRLENPLPFRRWREYKQRRGMSFWRDYIDWVGGYPYETAKPEDIFEFYRSRGFSLQFLQTGGLGCNEFVFQYGENVRSQTAPTVSISETVGAVYDRATGVTAVRY
jgi:2-polyprenyl-3-methyl-5-hydroxy-6-metoxy-1,4-benzoquinol methylase